MKKKTAKKPVLVKVQQLIDILQISASTVSTRWIRESKPLPRRKIGKAYMYDLEQVYFWLLADGRAGRVDYAEKLLPYLPNQNPPKKRKAKAKKTVKPSETPDAPIVPKPDGNIQDDKTAPAPESEEGYDLFASYRHLCIILKRITDVIENTDIKDLHTSQIKIMHDMQAEVRQTTKAIIEIDTDLKKVMQFTDVKKFTGTVITIMRTSLQTLSFSLADKLAAIDDPVKIREVLKPALDDVLWNASDRFKNMQVDN